MRRGQKEKRDPAPSFALNEGLGFKLALAKRNRTVNFQYLSCFKLFRRTKMGVNLINVTGNVRYKPVPSCFCRRGLLMFQNKSLPNERTALLSTCSTTETDEAAYKCKCGKSPRYPDRDHSRAAGAYPQLLSGEGGGHRSPVRRRTFLSIPLLLKQKWEQLNQ